MRTTRRQRWVFLAIVSAALTLCAGWTARADDSYYGPPLVQVRFDQLIPTSYPIVTPKFDRLRQTNVPLIDPGIARVPITENLIHPLDQPLLIASEGFGQVTQVNLKRQSMSHPGYPAAERQAR